MLLLCVCVCVLLGIKLLATIREVLQQLKFTPDPTLYYV